ncbi:MAG: 7-cyano-7-deazaguanine synthase [Candidatus Bathyarchaeia archaeon]
MISLKRPKALALLSGGLDSVLAVKLVQEQGVDIEAINFITPFSINVKGNLVREIAKNIGIPLKVVDIGLEYLRIIRRPRFGYGRYMNPCIDCRIFMLKEAKKYAEEIGAQFIVTGEVLDERPMSQNMKALMIIEEESSLKGRILRPLSAKLLPETVVEKEGIIDRSRLLDIRGRSRRRQLMLAKELGITSYEWPSGGCLLTYREFSAKLRDLLKHKKRISLSDLKLLRIGRHFRYMDNKIIVGRNYEENQKLLMLKAKSDYVFEAQGCGSPITILQGPKTRQAVLKAAQLTAYYSDQKAGLVHIKYGKEKPAKSIYVEKPAKEYVELLRIK